MRMRPGESPNLIPSADTLARALGPIESAPPSSATAPSRRKTRIPATGLTTLEPELDRNVETGRLHPHYLRVLATAERLFNPDPERVADEVRGDLNARTSIRRWILGAFAGDRNAVETQTPRLACLICVTLRPPQPPALVVEGPSGNRSFDLSAQSSLSTAATRLSLDDDVEPARACYHFAAKVWRQRPDITNLGIPFKLHFKTTVRLVTYERVGG